MKLQENKRWSYDRLTDDSQTVWKVHKRSACTGDHCSVHKPSEHPLRDAKMVLRQGSPWSMKPHGFVERFCDHGIGHSDPDSVAFFSGIGLHGTGVHGCDGCCSGRYEELQRPQEGIAYKGETDDSTSV